MKLPERKALLTKLESFFKRMLAPVGKRKLRQMVEDGFPADFHSPLLLLLTGSSDPNEQAIFEKIDAIRKSVNGATVGVLQGIREAGGNRNVRVVTRNLQYLESVASVPGYWGAFLHRCANAARARIILELGCCLGISGCYLASGRFCERFITIEGSNDLAEIAQANLRQITQRFRIIPALFEEGLNEVLPSLPEGLDLVHIDGDHNEEMTLHYFERILPHLHPGSLVLFDDIHYSPDMWNAWNKIAGWKGAAYSVDVGRYGMILWRGESCEPKVYDLSRFAREW
ncbi:MAG TPA: class I SAM-dependent methyltransferase, partial [Acidobacteriota bacterium]|nr:class I SAM-dependent methyltransferase [Acidobacteriota bacterium]